MYTANLTGGGLLLHESRVVAQLLLSGVSAGSLAREILDGNLLQKRTPETSRRVLRLVIPRLRDLPKPFLEFLLSAGSTEASLFLLALCCETHRILGDFLVYIRRECLDQHRTRIFPEDWNHYFARCADADPRLESWTESTRKKLRGNILGMLADAGVMERKTGSILRIQFPAELAEYLAMPGHEQARVMMEGLLP